MEKKTNRRYSAEFKEQILKEVKETKNAALVARTHGLIYQTVSGWVAAERQVPARKRAQEKKRQEIQLKKLELENQILKEILKKTNQAWLCDEASQNSLSSRGT